MAISIKKVGYQLQLTDAIKAQYPNDPIVRLLLSQLADVANTIDDGHYLVKRNNIIEGTAVAPGSGGLNSGSSFPSSPTANDLFLLTRKSGANEIGLYQYQSGSWVSILSQVEDEDIPQGTQLPAQATGVFILTATHLNNSPGLYASVNNSWQQIASIYSDTAVRALITALTGRVNNLEGDNPVTLLSISGNTLTVTQKDGTTSDLTLPVGGTGGAVTPTQPVTTEIIYGLSASIDEIRDNTEASKNLAKAGALLAYQTNNQAEAQTATSGIRNSKTADNIFSGSYINLQAPASPANKYYNAWVIVPTNNLTFLRSVIITGDEAGEDDTTSWEADESANVGAGMRLYVRTTELESGESLGIEFKAYR